MNAHKVCLVCSGGDVSGMNALITHLCQTAWQHGWSVVAANGGYQGLMTGDIHNISAEQIIDIARRGGTILKSGRCPAMHQYAERQKIAQNIERSQIDVIIVLGGNGSLCGAAQLDGELDCTVLGIPCTIDNDINGSDTTIGFDSACNSACANIDRLRDTCISHSSHFIIEVMGHYRGFLALAIGLASNAHGIILPEYPLSQQDLVAYFQQQPKISSHWLAVMAEGQQPYQSVGLCQTLNTQTPYTFRPCILGHTQRGGAPSYLDRYLCRAMVDFLYKQWISNPKTAGWVAHVNGQCQLQPWDIDQLQAEKPLSITMDAPILQPQS